MKYLLTACLFTLAAICIAGLIATPYNPGMPRIDSRTIQETTYIGGNFGLVMMLWVAAVAAGLGGVIALLCAIDADKAIREEEIRAKRLR